MLGQLRASRSLSWSLLGGLCLVLVLGAISTRAPEELPVVLRATGPTAPPDRPPLVVAVDPGHPSETSPGNVVQNGTTEVHVAWMVALKLRARLQERGYRVVMTKSAEGQLVTNRDRARIANEAGAALLVRLHADTGPHRGFALYYPDRQGTTAGVTGPSPAIIERSREAAAALHQGMSATLRGVLHDGGVLGDSRTYVGSRQGALTGSIFSTVPVVTVEMVVLADPEDAAFIRAESGQARMAEGIAAGIERFLRARSTAGGSGR